MTSERISRPVCSNHSYERSGRLLTDRILAAVEIESLQNGTIDLKVHAIEPKAFFKLETATVVLSIWSESGNVVRARLEHVESGATSYLQGNASLLELGKELGLCAAHIQGAE